MKKTKKRELLESLEDIDILVNVELDLAREMADPVAATDRLLRAIEFRLRALVEIATYRLKRNPVEIERKSDPV